MCYGREAISTLFGAQYPNRLHRRDPHEEEGRIECSFDLQCHRLAEIMGLYWRSIEIVIFLKKMKHFGRPKRLSKLVPFWAVSFIQHCLQISCLDWGWSVGFQLLSGRSSLRWSIYGAVSSGSTSAFGSSFFTFSFTHDHHSQTSDNSLYHDPGGSRSVSPSSQYVGRGCIDKQNGPKLKFEVRIL